MTQGATYSADRIKTQPEKNRSPPDLGFGHFDEFQAPLRTSAQ
jgi:hypothetical protein